MLNRKLIAICCETHTQHRNTLCGQEKKYLILNMVVHKVIVRIHRVHSIKFILLYLHTFFRTKKQK